MPPCQENFLPFSLFPQLLKGAGRPKCHAVLEHLEGAGFYNLERILLFALNNSLFVQHHQFNGSGADVDAAESHARILSSSTKPFS